MRKIRLRHNIAMADPIDWTSGDGVRFLISRDSSFSFLAEPLAISRLYQLSRSGTRLSADILHDLPSTDELESENIRESGIADSLSRTAASKLGLMDSLFGLALLNTAATVVRNRGDISSHLQDQLWNRLHTRRGIIGSGNYVAIVSRDPDMSIPHVLRENDRRVFPSRKKFRDLLGKIGEEMGITSDLIASPLEQALVTFLYEVAKNAHEHGRTTLEGSPLSGIRGVIVQKLRTLSLDELQSRSMFPKQLRLYLSRAWSPSSAKGILVAITITDTGPGIHHTLTPIERESDWERLGRAFLPGESSKPAGVEGRGQGFNLVLDAFRSCRELRAFLFVRSANLLAYRDFTDQVFEDATEGRPYSLQPWDYEVSYGIGSSCTVIWPVLDTSPLQGKLPLS